MVSLAISFFLSIFSFSFFLRNFKRHSKINLFLQDIQFISIISIIYLPDMIESGRTFCFFSGINISAVCHHYIMRGKKMWVMRLHQLRSTALKHLSSHLHQNKSTKTEETICKLLNEHGSGSETAAAKLGALNNKLCRASRNFQNSSVALGGWTGVPKHLPPEMMSGDFVSNPSSATPPASLIWNQQSSSSRTGPHPPTSTSFHCFDCFVSPPPSLPVRPGTPRGNPPTPAARVRFLAERGTDFISMTKER